MASRYKKDDGTEWDIFAGNHFLGRIVAENETEALETGLRLHGSFMDGILNVRPRVQEVKDGWSRPI
jgi:hypothetical protein